MSNLLRNKPLDVVLASAPYVILGIGFIIRLKILIQNRSLFIDEASLARNLCEGGYAEFFTSLSYEQYAPPLFMVESKMMVQLFGNYEWAMRLIPFIAGLGTMWVLWLLLQEWVSSPVVRIYGLSLFCFSFLAIRYGTEFKQYSGDAFLSLVFVWLAWKDRALDWRFSDGLKWGMLGAIAIWYSMPLVFTLSGVGLFFLWRQRKHLWFPVFISICFWLFSFGIYYLLILRHDIGSDYLEGFFKLNFLEVFSLSKEDWVNNLALISELIRNITDKTALSIAFGLLASSIGTISLIRSDKSKGLLVLVPIVGLLLASVFHFYPLKARLTLFIFPLIILLVSLGLDKLWSFNHKGLQGLVLVLICVGILNKKAWVHIRDGMTFEEIRPCLNVLSSEISPADIIYVDHEAIPAFEFYQEHYKEPFAFHNPIVRGEWDTHLATVLEKHPGQKFWLVYSHALDSEIQRNIQLIEPKLIDSKFQSKRVGLFFYDPSENE